MFMLPLAVVQEPSEARAEIWRLASMLVRIGVRVLHQFAARGCAANRVRTDLAHRSWTEADLDALMGIDRNRS